MRKSLAAVPLFAGVWTLMAVAGPAAGQPPDTVGADGACAVSSPAEWRGLDGGPGWNGWGAGVTNARFQPADQAGLAAADVPRLRLKWAFGYPRSASAQSQPTVVGGRLFVASERGEVYALDAATGCTHWTFAAASGVRSAMTVTRLADGRHALFFGDFAANVYALDAATGVEITAIPGAVFSGAYDGLFRAYAAGDGSVLWEFDTNGEHDTVNGVEARGGSINGAGPVVVGGMVYVNSGYAAFGGRPGNVLLAFGVD